MTAPHGWPFVGVTSPEGWPSTGRSVSASIWATSSQPLPSCCFYRECASNVIPLQTIHCLTTLPLRLIHGLLGGYISSLLSEAYWCVVSAKWVRVDFQDAAHRMLSCPPLITRRPSMMSRPLTTPPDEQPSTTLPLVSRSLKFKFDFKKAFNDTKANNYKEPRTIAPLASRPPKLELQQALAPSS